MCHCEKDCEIALVIVAAALLEGKFFRGVHNHNMSVGYYIANVGFFMKEPEAERYTGSDYTVRDRSVRLGVYVSLMLFVRVFVTK